MNFFGPTFALKNKIRGEGRWCVLFYKFFSSDLGREGRGRESKNIWGATKKRLDRVQRKCILPDNTSKEAI